MPAALWFVATMMVWVLLPVVFKPRHMACPLSPLWPSCGIFATIFLIGKPLGDQSLEIATALRSVSFNLVLTGT
jgi:hypothetical protein